MLIFLAYSFVDTCFSGHYIMISQDYKNVALSDMNLRNILQGRCHKERSGFDGPWTANPLIFDNSYFT